jgi:uncharacterized protein YegJ (DUF2314 family)
MGLWSWLVQLLRGRRPLEARNPGDTRGPINALVLFLREPRELTTRQIARIATKAFDVPFTDDEPDATDNFVAGAMPSFVLKTGDHYFLVNSFPRPYTDNPVEASESIPELRLRKAVRDHEAWISVDLLGEAGPSELPGIYRSLGRLLVGFLDDDCLAIFATNQGQLVAYDPAMRATLMGDNPLSLFETMSHPPVVPVADDDPRLKAAVAKARRRWPEFVEAFENRRPEQHFAMKARITEPGENQAEFMWITVTGLENGIVYGKLDNDPVELTRIKAGDRVRVSVKDLNDWLYTDGDDMVGGFTIEVLRRIQDEMTE